MQASLTTLVDPVGMPGVAAGFFRVVFRLEWPEDDAIDRHPVARARDHARVIASDDDLVGKLLGAVFRRERSKRDDEPLRRAGRITDDAVARRNGVHRG